jgi:hypothetical protein
MMFFTGCSEEEETITGSTDEESYTIDDMVGTWDMVSNIEESSISMDLSPIVAFYPTLLVELDQMECEDYGFTWDSDTCTASDEQIAEIVGDYCSSECDDGLNQYECEDYGCDWDNDSQECLADEEATTYTLVGNTCTIEMSYEECCEEGQSTSITITSEGAVTLTGMDEGGAWEDTGVISIDGTNITVSLDENCECYDLEDQTECEATVGCDFDEYDDECYGEYMGDCSDTISGTLSIDGNTATMSWDTDEDEFLEDFMDEDDDEDMCYDLSESECDYSYDCTWVDDENNLGCFSAADEMDFDLSAPTVSVTHIMVWEKAAE